MRKQVSPTELLPHPENDYYFDRMEESKWGDFKESIQKNGLYESPIVTPENLIVSGHERVRACMELGIKEIEVEVRNFASDDEILICLIETNIQQRGSIGGSVIKMARRIQALERCYGIRHGNNGLGQDADSSLKTQDQLASEMGMSARNMRMIRNLADLPEEFQQMVDDGKITATAAAKLIVGLTSKEKDELLAYLSEHDESVKRFTEEQISGYIEAIKEIETRIKDYQELSSGSSEDYMRIVDEKERMKSEAMKSLAELNFAKSQLREAKKELSALQKQASQHEKLKEELEGVQNDLNMLRQHGTTISQVTHSLNGVLSIVSGIANAQIYGQAKQKEIDQINRLADKINEGLDAVKSLVMGAPLNQSA